MRVNNKPFFKLFCLLGSEFWALEVKAEKLRSALIVDPEDADDIEQILKLNQVEYERKELWVPEVVSRKGRT